MGIADFFRPKWRHSNSKIRQFATEELTDQKLLTQIAMSGDFHTAHIAAKKITDQEVLAQIAWRSSYFGAQLLAVDKMTNHDALSNIAATHRDIGIRLCALEKLGRQSDIAWIVKTGDRHARHLAILSLRDQALLAEIAQQDENRKLRKLALERLTDPRVRAEIEKISDSDRERMIQKAANDHERAALVSKYGDLVVAADIREDASLSAGDIKVNAGVNAHQYRHLKHVDILMRDGRMIGLWVKDFPANTTKNAFLAICFVAARQEHDDWVKWDRDGAERGHSKSLSGEFTIHRASRGGYTVIFTGWG